METEKQMAQNWKPKKYYMFIYSMQNVCATIHCSEKYYQNNNYQKIIISGVVTDLKTARLYFKRVMLDAIQRVFIVFALYLI